jgi:DNA-binding transcriptional LysR family regulator
MDITLRQLQIFLAVARHEHVSRAAEALLLAQSAVSSALAELGRQLGGPLVERAGRRIALTERGRRLIPEAEDLVRRADDLLANFRSEGRLAGDLRVGGSSTIGTYVLPELIGKFAHAHPDVRVRLTVGNSADVEQALADRRLDVAFIEGPPTLPELTATAWRDDCLVVFAAPSHRLAAVGTADGRALAGERWVVREPGSGTRSVFDAALRDAALQVDARLELGDSEAVKQAVRAGLGLGCLSTLAVARELASGDLVAIRTPMLGLQRRLWRLSRRHSHEGRLAAAFVTSAAS